MTELTHSTSQSEDILAQPISTLVKFDWEKAIYLLFIALALLSRFWGLGDRVVSHDESLHTQYSYQYYNGDGYNHTPLMHGPSLFHFTAISFWLFGDSDFTSRIPVAIVGVLLVVLPYFLRGWIGRFGAIFASFLLLISPYISYYSRYIRHDIYAITLATIAFIAINYYLRQRDEKYLWWLAASLGLLFATMETSYIYVAIFGSFIVVRMTAKILTAEWFRRSLSELQLPAGLLGLAIVAIAIGYIGQRVTPSVFDAATPDLATVTDEGFAADPNEPLTAPDGDEPESSAVTTMRWVQLAGIVVLAAGLFLTASTLRRHLEGLAEFDLVVLITTLVLPTSTSFLIALSGHDARDYSISTCQLAGQETMSALELFLNRVVHPDCQEVFFASGIVISTVFLVLTLATSVLVGLWWNRRTWLVAAAIFHGIFLVLFTSFFTNPAGWTSGMIGSLGYWLAQQEVQRADQPTGFYFLVLPLYEFLALSLTLAGAYLWARKKNLNKIVTYWLGTSLIMLLVFSLANWYLNRQALPEERTSLPAALMAALIFMAAVIYWLAARQKQLQSEYGLNRGWKGLATVADLTGFVPYLLWWFLASWLIYSLAGEKMAWLSSHFVVPMVLLGGWYLQQRFAGLDSGQLLSRAFLVHAGLVALFAVAAAVAVGPLLLGEIHLGSQRAEDLRGVGRLIGGLITAALLYHWQRRTGKTLDARIRRRSWLGAGVAILALMTIRFSYMANFLNADYTTEFLVYAHGAPATKSQVLSQLEELSLRMHGDKSIQVAYDNDSSWPFTWYLREYPNRLYFGENPGRNIADAPVVIAGSLNWGKVEPLLGDDYESRTYTFLWWPMEKYRNLTWASVLGDPDVAPEHRRGLGNPGVRQALWDIFFYRDYQRFGEVFGGTYSAGQWPLRHDLRMYIRKDTLATLWDHGIDAIAAEPPVDPYAENAFNLTPSLVIGSGGSAEGQLLQPRNLAIGENGLVYVADSGNHRIQVFDQSGNYVRGWGSFGALPGLFNEPWGLAVDRQHVYVADTWNHRIQKFTLEGELVAAFGESGSPEGGQSGGGLFFGPRDIVLMSDGNLLITDTGNHRIQVMDADGNFVTSFGTQGGLLGQFFEPVGLGVGRLGDIFLADTWNGRIQILSDELQAVRQWDVDAWKGESINNKPYIAVDPAGRIFVTDPEGYRVIVFNETGQYLARFGEFGTGIDAFGLPTGIKIDAEGNIYVADAGNNQILKFAPFL